MDASVVLIQEMSEEERSSSKVIKAEEILTKCMNNIVRKTSLLVWMPSMFELCPVKNEMDICTDGKHVFYCPKLVLQDYKRSGFKTIGPQLLHIFLHGVLGHFLDKDKFEDKQLAWAVMDKEVHEIERLLLPKENQSQERLKEQMGFNAFSKSYGYQSYFLGKKHANYRKEFLRAMQKIQSDRHEVWYTKELSLADKELWKNMADAVKQAGTGENMKKRDKVSQAILDGIQKAEKRQENIEYGNGSLSDLLSVSENTSVSDYTEILKSFFEEATVCKENIDTIDTMLYQYGLCLYEDIPLIEPQEESDQYVPGSFVVAIDTSGSCLGIIANQFVGELKRLFTQTKAFSSGVDVYLMLCDANICEEKHFTDSTQMEAWAIQNKIRGGGGTSFVPVFERIKQLQKKEKKQIKGLLYLSDGDGEYPKEQADYPVYFVIPDIGMSNSRNCIPDWINKASIHVERK